MSELQLFHANNVSSTAGYIVCFNACRFGEPIKIVVCDDLNKRTLLYLSCKTKDDYLQHYHRLQNGEYFTFRHTNNSIDTYKCIDNRINKMCLCTII